MSQNITDKALIKACLKNDLRAQKLFYERFYGLLMSVSLRYASDKSQASVLVNEVFLSIFENLNRYKPKKGSLKSWMYRIAVNKGIDHCRKELLKFQDLDGISKADHYGLYVENTAIANMRTEELLELIQRLSPSYRMVFNLFVVEGLSHEEIADQLGISIGSSKSNLHKARKKLQQYCAELEKVELIKDGQGY